MLNGERASNADGRSAVQWKPRRSFPRIDTLGRVFAGIGEGQEGSVVNLSLGGLLIRLRRILTPGSSYFLKLFLGNEIAVVEARVVRLVAHENDYMAGMEFLRISREDKITLQNFMGPAANPR
jgi:hypothetical protein